MSSKTTLILFFFIKNLLEDEIPDKENFEYLTKLDKKNLYWSTTNFFSKIYSFTKKKYWLKDPLMACIVSDVIKNIFLSFKFKIEENIKYLHKNNCLSILLIFFLYPN